MLVPLGVEIWQFCFLVMSELMNLFRQFKLGTCVFKTQERFTRGEYDLMPDGIKKIAKDKFVEKAARFILNKQPSSITEDNSNPEFIDIKCELMVFKVQDFKSIVEAAIQMMPMGAIEKIRSGETVLINLENKNEHESRAITCFEDLTKIILKLKEDGVSESETTTLLMREADYETTMGMLKSLPGEKSSLNSDRVNGEDLPDNVCQIMYGGYKFIIKSKK